jgi:hypothetical protein
MEDRKMAAFLAWFCRCVGKEELYIAADKNNAWIEDMEAIGDQEISFEEVVRRYNKSLPEYVPSILEPHIDSLNKLIDAKSQEEATDFSDWTHSESCHYSYWEDGYWHSWVYGDDPEGRLTTGELFLKYKQSKDDPS